MAKRNLSLPKNLPYRKSNRRPVDRNPIGRRRVQKTNWRFRHDNKNDQHKGIFDIRSADAARAEHHARTGRIRRTTGSG
ncbi:hypothetical protein [Lentisalinibacter orientalis]|uniref:hypothetical protein n=1 Tax=Lentisalinibacter orientalis TaxID=2992241 RepID=UPI0038677A97